MFIIKLYTKNLVGPLIMTHHVFLVHSLDYWDELSRLSSTFLQLINIT